MSEGGDNGLASRGFTLIELLAAILVMTVLVVIILPAFRSMQSASRRQRAAAQAAELAQAVLDYRLVYGTWPLETRARETDEPSLVAAAEEIGVNRHLELAPIVNLLRGLTPEGAAADPPAKENPRGIVFLELPASCFAAVSPGDGSSPEKGTPLDPWGRPYVLVLSKPRPKDGSVDVGRIEGGVRASVRTVSRDLPDGESFEVDSPDDAVAFSWGDPSMVTNATNPTRVIGSWSQRR